MAIKAKNYDLLIKRGLMMESEVELLNQEMIMMLQLVLQQIIISLID